MTPVSLLLIWGTSRVGAGGVERMEAEGEKLVRVIDYTSARMTDHWEKRQQEISPGSGISSHIQQ